MYLLQAITQTQTIHCENDFELSSVQLLPPYVCTSSLSPHRPHSLEGKSADVIPSRTMPHFHYSTSQPSHC